MNIISLGEANEFLANDPDIAQLKSFVNSELQEVDPKFAAIAVEANAFKDEIKIYDLITREMGLTPHMFPNRIPYNLEELTKNAQFIFAANYATGSTPWAKVEELAAPYVESLIRFIGANELSRLKYSAFTSHTINEERRLAGVDRLTNNTFDCGLFIFGWKATGPDAGFTYALGISAGDED